MGTFHVNGDISTNGNIKINELSKVATASKLAAFIENDSQKGFGYINLSDITVGAASKLANARTIKINLASTSAASFDGSANITPGVSGTLAIANGGTGATTVSGILTNLGITAITTAKIDEICDASISAASEVSV